NPTLTNAQVVDIITRNADDIGDPGFDQYFGNGRINVLKSLTAAKYAAAQTDTTAPKATITSPTSASTLKGKVSVAVAASDNVGVAKVDLRINGASFATATTAPFSFQWDTTTIPDGTYTLEAVAYDGAGNMGQSGNVAVKVVNTVDTTAIVPIDVIDAINSINQIDIIAPTVAITSLANGLTIGTKATVTIAASDNVSVNRIELYIDGNLRATSTGSTSLYYFWNTRKITSGAHTLTAKAFDATKNIGTTSVTVYK
ncbi:partial Chitodextrinase, partial [Planctomycetaceae bacterium]